MARFGPGAGKNSPKSPFPHRGIAKRYQQSVVEIRDIRAEGEPDEP